ncbi:MAG: hypothetical protein ACRD15_08675 [Vicinamibacterales bacterium]
MLPGPVPLDGARTVSQGANDCALQAHPATVAITTCPLPPVDANDAPSAGVSVKVQPDTLVVVLLGADVVLDVVTLVVVGRGASDFRSVKLSKDNGFPVQLRSVAPPVHCRV